MEFYMKLPRNKKEFTLYLFVISIISVNIIAPLITFFEVEFGANVWFDVLKVVPMLWLSVIVVVLATYKPAKWLTNRLVEKDDSFKVHMIINALCSVLLISIFMTVIGSWIGTRHISMEPIYMFFYKWPRNFAIAFAVECLLAQPLARLVMQSIHKNDKKIVEEKLEAQVTE